MWVCLGHLHWEPLHFLYLVGYLFFFRFGKFSAIVSWNKFSMSFSLLLEPLLTHAAAAAAAATAKSLRLTLCNPIDVRPPGSPIPGIFQARTLEWVVISFSSAWKWKVKVKSLSCVWLLVTPWTAAYQAPPSMGFSTQEYWSGRPLPSPVMHRLAYFTLSHISCMFLSVFFPFLSVLLIGWFLLCLLDYLFILLCHLVSCSLLLDCFLS